ncbi:hypothetical protein BU52_32950 [Streptomyces toyocaensis]|uniref:Uncharacterized protein n=1 Tax=Streptomyces toyocaensis TaxID=55952 RepID=A0A081XHH4_STRTO|nr:hypothetical protein BU52_32950 [Streptomyces toyocaensis]
MHHCSGHVGVPFDGLEAVLEPVAVAVDRDDFAVVQEAVEDRGGQDLVAKTWPHSPKVLFEVRMMEPFS